MCGIAGKVTRDGRPVDREVLERMCRALEHRGPDARGLHLAPGIGLGIQRLRIIDLERGDQPIFSEDGAVVVVLNGEIYNFQELRARLERRGHRFATRSDTEVIVHLYEEEGPACVRSLHGMFGLAVWDDRRRRLVLARDRVGKKPLFYALRDGELSFASELGALLEDPDVPREVDHAAIDAYLACRVVPAPLSPFRAVRKLPPAHVLVLEDGRADLRRYWELSYEPKLTFADDREAFEGVREQLRRAVRRRLVADVPLGLFLSGGVDSAAVAAAMAEASPAPVRTFSVGFPFGDYDELPRARMVARRFGTDHHEILVEHDVVAAVPAILRCHGEPFADSSAVPSSLVARFARAHVTVALNGDGGDESFGGYTRYTGQLALARADVLPLALRGALARLGEHVPPSPRLDGARSRARRLSAILPLPPGARYARYLSSLSTLDRDALYTPAFRELVGPPLVPAMFERCWAASAAGSPLDRMLDVDVRTYLPDDLLAKMDIATMAHGLEARSPLLDHELMEFAAALPARLKVAGRRRKIALRESMRGWVPDAVLDAPKRGFRLPVARWLRDELRPWSREVLLDDSSVGRGWFRRGEIERLLDRHAAGAEDHSQGLWTLLALELWFREQRPRSPTAAPAAAAPAGCPG